MRNRKKRSSGTGLDPSAVLYFTAAGITGNSEKTAVSNFFSTLRTNSILSKIAMLGLSSPTSETAALVDAIRLSSFTNVNSATWGSDGSWTFNGTSNYLNTNFDTGASSIVDDDSASLYIVSKLNTISPASVLIGCRDATAQFFLYTQGSPTKQILGYTWGASTDTSYNAAGNSYAGRFCTSRTAPAANEGYQDGASQNTDTNVNALTKQSGRNLFVGAYSNQGSAANFAILKTTVFFCGSGLTDAEVATVDTAVAALDTALGR